MAKAKVKALLSTGLAALCSHIKQCATAVSALANTTADGFDEVDDVLHEKQDITAAVPFTIPTTGWARDSTLTSYYYCDISITGLLATDIVDVTPQPESHSVARAAGFIPTESMGDSVSFFDDDGNMQAYSHCGHQGAVPYHKHCEVYRVGGISWH